MTGFVARALMCYGKQFRVTGIVVAGALMRKDSVCQDLMAGF